MSNRKETEAFILKYIEKLCPGGENTKIYLDLFASMDDSAFDNFMMQIEQGYSKLAVIAPNFGKSKLNTKRNLDLAKELGHNFFERLWIGSQGNSPTYLTPIPYMVVDIPVRRQAQLLVKKISIPDNNKTVDELTGQPTGASKGSKISYPETQIMAAMGLDASLTEMLKYRGGDLGGFNAMNKMISRSGGVSLAGIEPYATGVESTKTLKTYLTAMHLSNTL